MKNVFSIIIILLFCITQSGISQEISRFQGFLTYHHYEDSNKISKKEFESLLKTDDITYKYWKKSITYENLAALGTSVGIIVLFIGSNRSNDISNRSLVSAGGLVTFLTGISFQISSNKLERKAILRYNEQVAFGSLKFGPTPNGIGLGVNF